MNNDATEVLKQFLDTSSSDVLMTIAKGMLWSQEYKDRAEKLAADISTEFKATRGEVE